MKRVVVILCAAGLVTIAAACKPSAGGSCTENAKACDTPASRYACVDGHYVLESCKGPKGCGIEKEMTTCDNTLGDVGDPCASANQFACGTDGKTKLKCDQGKLAFVARCSKDGCTVGDTGGVHCNDPFGKVGDACKLNTTQSERAQGACNEDFKSELRCKDGKMALTHLCRGEQGCVPLSTGPWCDRSVGEPGDSCDANTPEFAVACDSTRSKLFTCKSGKLASPVSCGGEGKCYIRTYGQDGFSHYQAECDQSSSSLGDDCFKDGGLACSVDKQSRLKCDNGKFILDKECKKKIPHAKDEPDRSGCQIHAPDGTSYACE